ncbi:hypothetical protein ACF0H5_000019 [Mactra antiquata]
MRLNVYLSYHRIVGLPGCETKTQRSDKIKAKHDMKMCRTFVKVSSLDIVLSTTTYLTRDTSLENLSFHEIVNTTF